MSTAQAPSVVRLLRMGTFFWNVPSKTGSSEGARLARELASRLRADPRVVEVLNPDDDDTDYWFERFYPAEPPNMDSILFGTDAMVALVRRFPIAFRVRVPIKNQPIHSETADVPSDSYAVVWNGVTLVVLWSQVNEDIPLSGGHIVIDVLSDAVAGEAGASLINQACSLNCSFQFMHPTMILRPLSASEEDDDVDIGLAPIEGHSRASSHFDLSTYAADDGDWDVLQSLAYTLMDTANDFATIKTLGRRIIAIEEAARDELQHVITHQYRNSQVSFLPARKRLVARWKNRSTTRHLRQLLIALSLCLANLETLIRTWDEETRAFDETASEYGQAAFFETDSKSDRARICSLKLTHLESSVQQIADSLNNTAMVTATVGGALAGGLAGGVLGALATVLGT